MPRSCNSISNKFYCIFVIVFISSCASVNDINTTQFSGKIMISQNNHEPSTFNINVNIIKNDSIIQIKKPFYGNVLKIEMNAGKKTIFLPSEYIEPFYVPDNIDRNFRYWLRQCIFQKEFYIYKPIDEFHFKFQCNKSENRTNIRIEYSGFDVEGFLSLS